MTATKQFLTIYRHDYLPSNMKKPKRINIDAELTHTINEDYEFNNIRHALPPPRPSQIDLANEYLEETIKKEKPKIYKMYFKEPLQKSEIEPELKADSMYVRQFCNHMPKPVIDHMNVEFDSLESIETDMRDSYRPPNLLRSVERTVPIKPDNKITTTYQVISGILKTSYDSEYGYQIGALGKFIVDHEMFGKVNYPTE